MDFHTFFKSPQGEKVKQAIRADDIAVFHEAFFLTQFDTTQDYDNALLVCAGYALSPMRPSLTIFEYLLKETFIDIRKPIPDDDSGETLLHSAATKSDTWAAEVLLHNKADINAQTTTTKQTPLHYALEYRIAGLGNCAEFLIERGADLTLKDEFGKTPRDLATEFNLHAVSYAMDEAERRRAPQSVENLAIAQDYAAQTLDALKRKAPKTKIAFKGMS